jgi:hypothetical protein
MVLSNYKTLLINESKLALCKVHCIIQFLPVNTAGLVYRQRLRAREHRAVQREVIRPRRTRNLRNIQPVQADEQANVQPQPAVPQVQPAVPQVQPAVHESISPHRYVFSVLFCRFVDGLKY